jgi:hypothetical protein
MEMDGIGGRLRAACVGCEDSGRVWRYGDLKMRQHVVDFLNMGLDVACKR